MNLDFYVMHGAYRAMIKKLHDPSGKGSCACDFREDPGSCMFCKGGDSCSQLKHPCHSADAMMRFTHVAKTASCITIVHASNKQKTHKHDQKHFAARSGCSVEESIRRMDACTLDQHGDKEILWSSMETIDRDAEMSKKEKEKGQVFRC